MDTMVSILERLMKQVQQEKSRRKVWMGPNDDAQEESGGEDASEDTAKPMTLRDPGQMTAQEYDDHCAAGHVPWRSNCDSCIAGMGREDPHKKGK